MKRAFHLELNVVLNKSEVGLPSRDGSADKAGGPEMKTDTSIENK